MLQNKITILTIVVATISILFVNMESNLVKIYSQEGIPSSSIELTAKLVDNQYRWIGSNNSTNPTLNITSGVDNQISIKSLEGDPEEHELIIEGVSAATTAGGGNSDDEEGEELVASDEIEDGSSATVNFNPSDVDTNDYQSIEYYCEYHPDTMRGKIQIN
ncbi:MAG: Cupredoxin-like domain [Nitrososphaeraceae archaeon]|jgi:hypothetical protein|nr:Cupredoxin-like domain [Nitrososphaeraceae archaeon]